MSTVFTFNGTTEEFLSKLAQLAPAFTRPDPEKVIEGTIAKNEELQKAIDEATKSAQAAIAKEKDLTKLTSLLADVNAKIAALPRPVEVPTVAIIKEQYDAREKTWSVTWAKETFTNLGLVAPVAKNGQRAGKVKDGRVYFQDSLVMGMQLPANRAIIFSWGLDDNHKDRDYGGALIGNIVDGKFVEQGRTNNYSSASNLMQQAGAVWGITFAGINGTPLQSGVANKGSLLTKEQVASLV